MSYIFKAATLVTLDPVSIDQADLRIEAGRIIDRGAQLAPHPEDEVVNCDGKILMPGMVCAHTHLYSALARGMPPPPRAPASFREILELIWWRLDRALDEETIYCSALVGALDAVRAGTTCLFDHHASPSQITGSLQIVREAIEKVGLRGVLCYEVTDRGDRQQREQGLEENRAFLEWVAHAHPENSPGGRFRAMVGAHASFTLTDESIEACAGLMRRYGVGLHIHVAEDRCDVEDALTKYGIGVIERLDRHGVLNEQTILAHGIHLEEREIERARSSGVWFAHNPRSNMNNQVGYAPLRKFGERLVLGTDGIGADMFEEGRFGFFKGRDGHAGLGANDWLKVLATNLRLASLTFGMELGTLRPGAAADLIVLNYPSPTPLSPANLAWHLVFGLNSAMVETVMVDGQFIMRDKQLFIDGRAIYEQARKASQRLWARLTDL